jgi:hypothetical protein
MQYTVNPFKRNQQYHIVHDNMKLPKTKYEPSIGNGIPHGIPYSMPIRVLVPGTLDHPEWLEHPWPDVPDNLSMGCSDGGVYANVVIPDVPISSARRLFYDTALAGNNAPPIWASAVTGARDWVGYVQ